MPDAVTKCTPGEVYKAGIAHLMRGNVDVLAQHILQVDILQVDAVHLVALAFEPDGVAHIKRVCEKQEHTVFKDLADGVAKYEGEGEQACTPPRRSVRHWCRCDPGAPMDWAVTKTTVGCMHVHQDVDARACAAAAAS